MPKDFQCNFLRHKRNELALNSFLAGKLLTHDFGGAIVFISVNREVKCYSTYNSEEDIKPHFLHIKVLGIMYGTRVHTSYKVCTLYHRVS